MQLLLSAMSGRSIDGVARWRSPLLIAAYMPSRLTNIRRADLGDAKRLSTIAEETFRATISALNTREDIDLHCRNTYSEEIQASEIADPDTVTLIGEQDEKLVGYAQMRWRKAPSCVMAEAPGEIQRRQE